MHELTENIDQVLSVIPGLYLAFEALNNKIYIAKTLSVIFFLSYKTGVPRTLIFFQRSL
jgi:hypothetical protein